MKTKDITLVAILSASLTAGKMVLSAIPNVEIVTFLFIVYTVLFGRKRALMASIVFVTTEVFLYGFGTWLLGYYIMWPVLIILTDLLAKRFKSEYVFAGLSGLFGLFFGLFFAVFESIFYGVAYGITYWISGIPFDIMHGFSNFILALFLYKPIVVAIGNIKEKLHLN